MRFVVCGYNKLLFIIGGGGVDVTETAVGCEGGTILFNVCCDVIDGRLYCIELVDDENGSLYPLWPVMPNVDGLLLLYLLSEEYDAEATFGCFGWWCPYPCRWWLVLDVFCVDDEPQPPNNADVMDDCCDVLSSFVSNFCKPAKGEIYEDWLGLLYGDGWGVWGE